MRSAKLLLCLGLCLSASPAHAEDKQSCIDAHGRAQELRGKNDLVGAKAELSRCTQRSCPAMIRSDCGRFLEALNAEIPTVVFYVRNVGGDDIAEAKVSVDGKLMQSRLDGSGVAVNPGAHLVHFELADGRSFDKKVVVREGERLRPVGVELSSQTPAAEKQPAETKPADEPVSPPAHSARTTASPPTQSVLPYVLAGVGVLGLASFSYFGLTGRSKQQKLEACSPGCDGSRRGEFNDMQRDFLIADVSLGVGVAALAGAGVLFLTASKPSDDRPSASLRLGVSPTGIRAVGSF